MHINAQKHPRPHSDAQPLQALTPCPPWRCRAVKGLHINFAPSTSPSVAMVTSLMLGRRFPSLFGFTPFDLQRLFPLKETLLLEPIRESGYMHIQATKPDTVGESQSHGG